MVRGNDYIRIKLLSNKFITRADLSARDAFFGSNFMFHVFLSSHNVTVFVSKSMALTSDGWSYCYSKKITSCSIIEPPTECVKNSDSRIEMIIFESILTTF